MTEQLKKIFEDLIINPTNKEIYNRNHIFYDVKNMIKNQLTENQLIDVYYHFSLYEKCLKYSQERNFSLADYWVNNAKKLYADLSDNLKEPLGLMYYPMIAYYHFIREEHDSATDFLKKELFLIDNFIKDDALKIEFKLEQLINLYRLSFSMGNRKNILKYGTIILSYVLLNDSTNDFFKQKPFHLLDKKNREMWIDYVVNALLIKPLKQNDYELIQQLFENFSDFELANSSNLNIISAIKIILNKNVTKNEINDVITHINTYPDYLQFLIIEKLRQQF
jgi:hypothetical protein